MHTSYYSTCEHPTNAKKNVWVAESAAAHFMQSNTMRRQQALARSRGARVLCARFTTSAYTLITFELWRIYALGPIAACKPCSYFNDIEGNRQIITILLLSCVWHANRVTVACPAANRMRWWWCDCVTTNNMRWCRGAANALWYAACKALSVHFVYEISKCHRILRWRIGAYGYYVVVTLMWIPLFHISTIHFKINALTFERKR